MGEIAGDGPLLLTLLMGNNNNNAMAQAAAANPPAGIVLTHRKVVEVITQDQGSGLRPPGIIRLRAENPGPQGLTEPQIQSYNENGYLVLPDALTARDVDILLEEVHDLAKRVTEGGEGVIQYDDSGKSDELLSPIGRVLATFEAVPNNSSVIPTDSISRFGCGVHQRLPLFRTITHSALSRSITKSLGYTEPRVTQSQLVVKLARVSSSIVPHQDGCVSFTDPPSAATFWYALEDATLENGCLCVAAGSHVAEPLRKRLIIGDNGVPRFQELDFPLWAEGVESEENDAGQKREEWDFTPLEVRKGSLVVFHGNLIHKSAANGSERNRVAYMFSVIEGSLGYADDGYMKVLGGEMEKL